jgi:hypothetical protein
VYSLDSTEPVVIDVGQTEFVASSQDGKTYYVTQPVGHTRRAMITNYGDMPRPWAKK